MDHTQPANPGFPLVQIALSMDSVEDINRLGPVLRSLLSPTIFGYANGGVVAGGTAVVGENGPGLAVAPGGIDIGPVRLAYPTLTAPHSSNQCEGKVTPAQTTDETDQDGDDEAATGEKPKRKRRTKEQIAADNAAAEATKHAEEPHVPNETTQAAIATAESGGVASDSVEALMAEVNNKPAEGTPVAAPAYKVPQDAKEMLKLLTDFAKDRGGDTLKKILNEKMNAANFSAVHEDRYGELMSHLPADWLEKRYVA